ncbi:MAG: zinc-ribbon domain-containing protein [Clostridia bacterium]|nr:zinc-ribbon domain-containing protein [Clostridia bacterium]
MAKFCQNCGSALDEGVKFCPSCGSPVPQAAQPQQPKSSPDPQPQRQADPQPYSYTPRPQVRIPEQFAQRNAARAQQQASAGRQPAQQQAYVYQQSAAPAKKKNGKGGKAFLVILLVAVIGIIGFFGFRDGGWFRSNKSYDAQHMQSLLSYARQLEKAGNSEAAAAVYELIAKGGGAELIQKAHEEIPAVEKMDEIEQVEEIMDHIKGGGVK